MMSDDVINAVNKLSAKVTVMEMILRTLFVENLLKTPDPVATMRDYANRIETVLVDAMADEAGGRPGMLLQSEIAEQFAVIEKWLRQSGAQ